MKRYPLSHVDNLRDLGGYPAADNSFTKYGRLLRSDAPVCVSVEEIEFIYNLGIRTIIDLRSIDEIKRNPSAFFDKHEFNYINCQFGLGNVWLAEDDIPVYYTELADDPAMPQVMEAIAESTGGVLFNCTAGKDRTGVVAALLLSLAGVSRNDILADYQVTYTYIQNKVKTLLKSNPDYPYFTGYSEVRYMNSFLDWFYDKYGSVDAYFKNILKLGQSATQKIRDKLLKENIDIVRSV